MSWTVLMSLNFPGMVFRLTLWLALIAVLPCAPVVLGEDVGMNGKSAYSKRVEQLIHECYLRYPEPPWITLGEFLRRRKQEEWVIVDVRSRQERKVSIIPGALGIDELKRRIRHYKGENILVYCTVGCRSVLMHNVCAKEGFKHSISEEGYWFGRWTGGRLSPVTGKRLIAYTSTPANGMYSPQVMKQFGEGGVK